MASTISGLSGLEAAGEPGVLQRVVVHEDEGLVGIGQTVVRLGDRGADPVRHGSSGVDVAELGRFQEAEWPYRLGAERVLGDVVG